MTTRRKIQNRQRTKNAIRRIKRRNDKIHKLLRSRKNKATRKYSQQKSKMIGGGGGQDYVAFNIYFYPEDIAGEYRKKREEVLTYYKKYDNERGRRDYYLFGGPNPRFCVPYYDEYLFAVIVYDSNNLYVFDNPKFNLGGKDKKNEKLRLLIKTLFGIDVSKDPNASKSVDKIIFDEKGKGIVLKPNKYKIGGTHKLQQTNQKDQYEDMNNVTPIQTATELLTEFNRLALKKLTEFNRLTLKEFNKLTLKELEDTENLKLQLEAIIQELKFDNFKFAVEPTKQIFPVEIPWYAWDSRSGEYYYYENLLKGRSDTVKKYCIAQNNDIGNKPTTEENYDILEHNYGYVAGDDN